MSERKERLYWLPLHETCSYACAYCEAIGALAPAKRTSASLTRSLRKAALGRYDGLIVPCNAMATNPNTLLTDFGKPPNALSESTGNDIDPQSQGRSSPAGNQGCEPVGIDQHWAVSWSLTHSLGAFRSAPEPSPDETLSLEAILQQSCMYVMLNTAYSADDWSNSLAKLPDIVSRLSF